VTSASGPKRPGRRDQARPSRPPSSSDADGLTELEATRKELREARAQQTAVADVLKVIGSSVFVIQPALDAIVSAARRLCDADGAVIWRPLGDEWAYAAGAGAGLRISGDHFRPDAAPETVLARCVLQGTTIHSRDARRDGLPDPDELLTRLGVPVMRSGEVVAVIIVTREVAGGFSDREVGLVQTFADQAAIAIENVRLLNEIQDKSQALEAASRHKSEFLANMSHELRTPLNAVIGFSDVLEQRLFGELNERQSDYVRDIASSGRHLLEVVNEILDLQGRGRSAGARAKRVRPGRDDPGGTRVRPRASGRPWHRARGQSSQ
jgi:GAF domain-containing protein